MVNERVILRKSAKIVGLTLGLCLATSLPAQVAQVDYASLTGTESVSFSSLAGGAAPGTNIILLSSSTASRSESASPARQ